MQIKSLTTLLAFTLIIFCPYAMGAETTTTSLPYESWLRTIQKSLTGPVAFSVSLIGIVSSGATLIFTGGELGRFMRTIIYIVLVMTLLIGANTLMTNLFNGAVIDSETLKSQSLNSMQIPNENKEILLEKHSIRYFQKSALSSLLPKLNEEPC